MKKFAFRLNGYDSIVDAEDIISALHKFIDMERLVISDPCTEEIIILGELIDIHKVLEL